MVVPVIQAPLRMAFTYQGQLKQNGGPVNSACDFRFILYSVEVGGSQIGPTQEKSGVGASGGLFTVPDLDFGAGAFNGDVWWLRRSRCAARPAVAASRPFPAGRR